MALAKDPIKLFLKSFQKASKNHDSHFDMMVLATALHNRPSARVVLYKGVFNEAVRFFTNYQSKKSCELDRNPYAALVFYWHSLGVQVRIEGRVRRISKAESDQYWKTRPRESQLSGYISPQSKPIAQYRQLRAQVTKARQLFRGCEISRPNYWGGYDLVPQRIEFWFRGNNRLHYRELYVRKGKKWNVLVLAP